MTDPIHRPDLGREVAELKRRLDALERSPKLTDARVTGYLRVVDDTEQERARIGRNAEGTDFELSLMDADGVELFRTDATGLSRPQASVPMFRTTDVLATTTSGSWTDLWELRFQSLWSEGLGVGMAITVSVGTTAEVRIGISNVPLWSNALALSASANLTAEVLWLHSRDLGQVSPLTSSLLKVQGRVTSGAGAVNVQAPTVAPTCAADGATAGGAWFTT